MLQKLVFFLATCLRRLLLAAGMDLVLVDGPPSDLACIAKVRSERSLILSNCGACSIMGLARATGRVPGALAEVGVFQGASARLMCEVKGDRELYLFDTFEGLPQTTSEDSGSPFYSGQFEYSLAKVREYLRDFPNVHLNKGLFPQESAAPVQDKQFSFVHLDVDLYQSTLDSLRFFYPRTNPGGIIISHDFRQPGVFSAFREFFADKPETVIPLPGGDQALIMKM